MWVASKDRDLEILKRVLQKRPMYTFIHTHTHTVTHTHTYTRTNAHTIIMTHKYIYIYIYVYICIYEFLSKDPTPGAPLYFFLQLCGSTAEPKSAPFDSQKTSFQMPLVVSLKPIVGGLIRRLYYRDIDTDRDKDTDIDTAIETDTDIHTDTQTPTQTQTHVRTQTRD